LFIQGLWIEKNWPSNLPYLNLAECSIWSAIWHMVYRQTIEDEEINHLQQVLNSCWDMISQKIGFSLFNGTVKQWFKQASSVVRFCGKH